MAIDQIARLNSIRSEHRSVQNSLPHLFDSSLLTHPTQVEASTRAKESFSTEQMSAYQNLRQVPGGFFFMNGHAGTGKTHWATHLAAFSQLETRSPVDTKVLYLLETSQAVDDISSKLGMLYKKFKIPKKIVRINGLPQRFEEVEDVTKHKTTKDSSDRRAVLDFTMGFLQEILEHEKGQPYQYRVGPNGQMWVPELGLPHPRREVRNLDEAAYAYFLRNRQYFHELHLAATNIRKMVECDDKRRYLPDLKDPLWRLYHTTVSVADIVITTPEVAVHELVTSVFKPTIIIYDQAGKARELSTLISIGSYDPLLTVLVGDVTQLLPSSRKETQQVHQFYYALETSTLARVTHKGRHNALLEVNHRAKGRLYELPSKLYYWGAMRSSTSSSETFPVSVKKVREWLDALRGRRSEVPRLLVSLFYSSWETIRDHTSWNPVHHAWILEKVQDLLKKPWFQSGTVLIITSSKGSSSEYDEALEGWPSTLRRRVTLRTFNTVQGSSGDVVFFDVVKGSAYTDDPNRLATALTKSILGEVILMSYYIASKRLQRGGISPSKHLIKVWEECEKDGQILKDNRYGSDIKARIEARRLERERRQRERFDLPRE